MKNPFLTYGYAGPAYFCDREEETKYLATADKPCIVAIDEFQTIMDYPKENIQDHLTRLTINQKSLLLAIAHSDSDNYLSGAIYNKEKRNIWKEQEINISLKEK